MLCGDVCVHVNYTQAHGIWSRTSFPPTRSEDCGSMDAFVVRSALLLLGPKRAPFFYWRDLWVPCGMKTGTNCLRVSSF